MVVFYIIVYLVGTVVSIFSYFLTDGGMQNLNKCGKTIKVHSS